MRLALNAHDAFREVQFVHIGFFTLIIIDIDADGIGGFDIVQKIKNYYAEIIQQDFDGQQPDKKIWFFAYSSIDNANIRN